MGHQRQSFCRLFGNRGNGHRHQRRRRHGAGPARRDDGGPERTGHSKAGREPAACDPERGPCQPGTGAAGLAQRRGAAGTRQSDESDPADRARKTRRDHRTRSRQGRGVGADRDRQEYRRHHRETRRRGEGATGYGGPARKTVSGRSTPSSDPPTFRGTTPRKPRGRWSNSATSSPPAT